MGWSYIKAHDCFSGILKEKLLGIGVVKLQKPNQNKYLVFSFYPLSLYPCYLSLPMLISLPRLFFYILMIHQCLFISTSINDFKSKRFYKSFFWKLGYNNSTTPPIYCVCSHLIKKFKKINFLTLHPRAIRTTA